MAYCDVSKKMCYQGVLFLTLFFVSMNSVWAGAYFNGVATKAHPNDPKTPKRRILKRFVDVSEFKEIDVDSADKEQWNNIADQIKKAAEELFKLERELSKLKKYGLNYMLKEGKVLGVRISHRMLLKKARDLFATKMLNKMLKRRGFDNVAVTTYKGKKITKKFDDIPELKEIDPTSSYKDRWDGNSRYMKTMIDNYSPRSRSAERYHEGLRSAEGLFNEIIAKGVYVEKSGRIK